MTTTPITPCSSDNPKIIYYGKIPSTKVPLQSSSEDDETANPSQGPCKTDICNMKTMFVDVIVRNAVSPLNFTIQNYRQSLLLKNLESGMTSYFNASLSTPLSFTDLMLNGYYAVKHKSDLSQPWVRCQIMKPFHEHMPVLTYLIDHGIYYVTEPQDLQHLKRTFLNLSVQSYEAKLHFVRNQLTSEDCLRFQKIVQGKELCAIIIPTNSPNVNQDDKVSLVLIDTSTSKDEYVHQHFVTTNTVRTCKSRS